MEHRYSSRITVAGDVGIYRQAAGWAAARLINMSTGGALLALDQNTLRPLTPITVVLGFQNGGESEWQTLRAMVVRNGRDGVGIEYLDDDRRCAHTLCRLIEDGCRSPFLSRGRALAHAGDARRDAADDAIGIERNYSPRITTKEYGSCSRTF